MNLSYKITDCYMSCLKENDCYLFAIDRIPAPVCFNSLVISSSKAGLLHKRIPHFTCMLVTQRILHGQAEKQNFSFCV